jgi:ATP-dependent Clp protease ATP-binding subunit ClpC
MYKAPYAPDLREHLHELKKLQKEKEEAVEASASTTPSTCATARVELEKKLEQLRKGWERGRAAAQGDRGGHRRGRRHVDGRPVSRIAGEERARLLEMEGMHKRVVGQDEPVKAIARAVRRARAGLKDPKRPIGASCSWARRASARRCWPRAGRVHVRLEEALIKLDMSEFMERHNVSRLVGAPPGYVGYEEGGQLTEAVRRRPYSVVLLDEIEKAHPEVFNMLLQIMEDGSLTRRQGPPVDFRNALLIMTSMSAPT